MLARLSIFLILACATGLLNAQDAGKRAENVIAEIFLAKSNSDGRAGEAATEFLVTDIPIFCVVRFTSPGVADVSIDLIAANVPGVERDSKVVSIAYTTKENEDRVNFSGRPQDEWVAGSYRVDVFLGRKVVRRIDFEIKATRTETADPVYVTPKRTDRKILKRRSVADRFALRPRSRFRLTSAT